MPNKIVITQDNINRAVKRNAHRCMIADAIVDKNPDLKFVHVDLQTVRFSDMKRGKRYIFLTPRVAQAALLDFDQGKKVLPFSFLLEYKNAKMADAKPRVVKVNTKRQGTHNKHAKKTSHPKPRRQREFGLCRLVK